MVIKLFTLDSTTKATANSELSLKKAFNHAKSTNKVMLFTGVGFWMIIESVEGVSKEFFIVFLDKRNKLVRMSPAVRVGSDVFIQKSTFITTDNELIIDLAVKLGSTLEPAK